MKYFREISPEEFPQVDKTLYPDYFVEDCETRIDRLFRYKDCYVEVFIDEEDSACMAIINLGEAFAISCVQEVVEKMVMEHTRGSFTWRKYIPNEILIQRLLKPYQITLECDEGDVRCVEFTSIKKKREKMGGNYETL